MTNVRLSCPRCGNAMRAEGYSPTIWLLKPRSWWICDSCSNTIDVNSYKKSVCCQ